MNAVAQRGPICAGSHIAERRLHPDGLGVHQAFMRLASVLIAMLAVQPGAALACSIARDPRPVEVQRDERARDSYLRAEAMVEVVALEGSHRRRPGLVRVVRVLKGKMRRGRLLRLRSVEGSMCGAGDFERGSSGLILLDRLRGRLVFQGYLPADYLTRLDRLGLRLSPRRRFADKAAAAVSLRPASRTGSRLPRGAAGRRRAPRASRRSRRRGMASSRGRGA